MGRMLPLLLCLSGCTLLSPISSFVRCSPFRSSEEDSFRRYQVTVAQSDANALPFELLREVGGGKTTYIGMSPLGSRVMMYSRSQERVLSSKARYFDFPYSLEEFVRMYELAFFPIDVVRVGLSSCGGAVSEDGNVRIIWNSDGSLIRVVPILSLGKSVGKVVILPEGRILFQKERGSEEPFTP
jgi:hypothetical protein